MNLEQVAHALEARLFSLGKRLTHGPGHQGERELLHHALRQAEANLRHCERALEQARARVTDNERQAAVLSSEVEAAVMREAGPEAWRLALALDELRQRGASDRADVAHLERACRKHREAIAGGELRLDLARRQRPRS
jgi:hypothetical protein